MSESNFIAPCVRYYARDPRGGKSLANSWRVTSDVTGSLTFKRPGSFRSESDSIWLWVKNRETPNWVTLANGMDYNLRCPGALILTHTHLFLHTKVFRPIYDHLSCGLGTSGQAVTTLSFGVSMLGCSRELPESNALVNDKMAKTCLPMVFF